MKKSIFILAALFAATFANAEITLERTIPGNCSESWTACKTYGDDLYSCTSYSSAVESYVVTIVDANSYEEIMSSIPHMGWFIAARGYFSNTNEVMLLKSSGTEGHVVLLNESGTIVQDFGTGFNVFSPSPEIISLSDGSCKLILKKDGSSLIYSLPGNGQATEISSPSSPKRSARKIANKGNVLVETDDHTYTLTGQEVK